MNSETKNLNEDTNFGNISIQELINLFVSYKKYISVGALLGLLFSSSILFLYLDKIETKIIISIPVTQISDDGKSQLLIKGNIPYQLTKIIENDQNTINVCNIKPNDYYLNQNSKNYNIKPILNTDNKFLLSIVSENYNIAELCSLAIIDTIISGLEKVASQKKENLLNEIKQINIYISDDLKLIEKLNPYKNEKIYYDLYINIRKLQNDEIITKEQYINISQSENFTKPFILSSNTISFIKKINLIIACSIIFAILTAIFLHFRSIVIKSLFYSK